jgi:hypothetical protein
MRAERSEANKRLLEAARATEARRPANVSARELTSGSRNAGRAAADVQRIREAVEKGCDFLSTDQEVRIREAAVGLPVEPEALLYSADCRAKQLCQENTSVELNLIVATIEEIVQSLIRELAKEKKRNNAAMSGGENLSKDSVSVTSIDMSIDQSTSSRASAPFKRPPPPSGSSSERRGHENIGQRDRDEGGQSSTSHSGPRQRSRGTIRILDGSRSQSRQRNRGSSAGSRRNGGQESGGTGERSRGAGGGRDEEEYDNGNTKEEEEPGDQRGSGRAASSRCSRPPSGRNFRGYQPGDAESSPVLQGVVNCLTSISNQMLRMSGKSGKNGGWLYFDGTFTGYPAFKRKWQSYYRNHHQLTPQRELVQLFRENCLHEKLRTVSRGLSQWRQRGLCWTHSSMTLCSSPRI